MSNFCFCIYIKKWVVDFISIYLYARAVAKHTVHRSYAARSIESPFWPAGGSPARDRRTAVLFPIEWNRRNKSADLEKESTAHYKVMQKLVKSAVFLYIFCEKKCSFLHISYIRQILAILRNRNTNIL